MSNRRQQSRRKRDRRKKNGILSIEKRTQNKRKSTDRRAFSAVNLERRADSRIDLQFPLTIVDSEAKAPRPHLLGSVQNLSSGGSQFTYPRQIGLNLTVDLCLYPPDLFIPLQMRGRIVWRRYIPATRSFQYGAAIEGMNHNAAATFEIFLKKVSSEGNSWKKRMLRQLEQLLYQRILRPILRSSLLGKASMESRADAGINFDHIYTCRAIGNGPIGRLIDHILLKLPAAEATRRRKDQLQKLIRQHILTRKEHGQKTRILDIGSGPSRYLLEIITQEFLCDVEAVCVDLDHESLKFGRELATSKPVRYVRANIFHAKHLLKFGEDKLWKPDLVIASGFIYYYEDRWVQKLMEEIYQWLSNDGSVIVTNLVGNPNRKLVGKLAITRDGRPWIPICRPPGLLRAWLATANYKEIRMEVDPWQMYSIYTASKLLPRSDPKERFEFVRIPVHSGIIKGKFYRGTGELKLPPVIFVHGLGYCTEFYDLNKSAFLERGFAFLEFNLRGHATSSGEFTLQRAIEDMDDIFSFLRNEGYDKGSFVLAHSVGALIAILASLKNLNILAIASVNTVTSLTSSFRYWFESGYIEKMRNDYTIAGKIHPGIAKFLESANSVEHFRQGVPSREDLSFPNRYGFLKLATVYGFFKEIVESPDLLDLAGKIKVPLLLIRGEIDEVISPELTDRLSERLNGQHPALLKLPAKDHFHTGWWDIICDRAANFFSENAKRLK